MSGTSTPSPVAQVFQTLLSNLEADAIGAAKPLFVTFFTAWKANPTGTVAAAQAAILVASLPLQLPTLAAEAMGQLADTGLALIALIPTPTPPAAAPPAA